MSNKKNVVTFDSPQLIELMRAVHEKGGVFRFQAQGFSMAPFIKDGDILTIAGSAGAYRPGDVVAYVVNGARKMIVHRIIGRKDNLFFIKGDNISASDGPVLLSSILGKVVKVERNGREIFLAIGPERIVIAWLSRYNMLAFILWLPRLFLKIKRKIISE